MILLIHSGISTLKRIAKADALKAWKQAIKKKTADELIGLTKAYSESKLPDMTYIPYPASWLNKGLYEAVEIVDNTPTEFKTGVFYK
jgi:hypothetical protein